MAADAATVIKLARCVNSAILIPEVPFVNGDTLLSYSTERVTDRDTDTAASEFY